MEIARLRKYRVRNREKELSIAKGEKEQMQCWVTEKKKRHKDW